MKTHRMILGVVLSPVLLVGAVIQVVGTAVLRIWTHATFTKEELLKVRQSRAVKELLAIREGL